MRKKLCFVNYLLSAFTLLQISNCVTTAQNSEWVRKSDAPQGIAFPNQSPQILNGKIYFLAGQDYLINKIVTYDPKKDYWFSKGHKADY